MKSTLAILFLLLSITAISQKSRIGFKLLPGLTDAHDPFEKQNFNNRLHPRTTFNFGGQYILELKDSLFYLESGIYYADRGSLQKDFISSYYYIGGDSTTISDIYHHSYHISVPVLFRMEFKTFYTSIGPTFDYYLNSKYVFTPEEDKIEKSNFSQGFPEDIKLGLDINLGAQFELTNKLDLFIEGSFHPSGFIKDKVNKKWYYHLTYEFGFGLNLKI